MTKINTDLIQEDLDNLSGIFDNKLTGKLNKGTILYDNSSGTNGNITLSDSLENYSRIVLLMQQSDNHYWWNESLDQPNGKTLWITKVQVDRTQSRYYLFEKRYTCSGTSINKAFIGTYFSNNNTYSEYDNFKIMKVIGYK